MRLAQWVISVGTDSTAMTTRLVPADSGMLSPVPASIPPHDGIEPEVLRWPVFGGLAIEAVVTTRRRGISEGAYESLNLGLHVGDDPARVVENRRRAAASMGLALSDLVFCTQVHGRAVAVVGEVHRGRGARSMDDTVGEADALVTTTPGLGLVVLAADCVPLVLFDPKAKVVACVHAGWRGTVARVADAALTAMASLGGAAERTLAGIGPAIAADRYEVGDEVAEAVHACFRGGAGDLIRPQRPGWPGAGDQWPDRAGGAGGVGCRRWRLDLVAATRRTLLEAGVPAGNIGLCGSATGAGTPFFSDRATRPCGRFAAIAALRR